jgi:hypothetical protein
VVATAVVAAGLELGFCSTARVPSALGVTSITPGRPPSKWLSRHLPSLEVRAKSDFASASKPRPVSGASFAKDNVAQKREPHPSDLQLNWLLIGSRWQVGPEAMHSTAECSGSCNTVLDARALDPATTLPLLSKLCRPFQDCVVAALSWPSQSFGLFNKSANQPDDLMINRSSKN